MNRFLLQSLPWLGITALAIMGCQPAVPTSPSPIVGAEALNRLFASPTSPRAVELGKSIEEATSIVELYHQKLRSLSRGPTPSDRASSKQQAGTPTLAERTASLYLSATPKTPILVPHIPSGASAKRAVTLLSQIAQLCEMSGIFQQRFNRAFGAKVGVQVCPTKMVKETLKLDTSNMATLVYQSINGRTATQRKNLLLLASLNVVQGLAPLVALPTLNLGQRVKVLSGLEGLDIGLIVAAVHPIHRAYLTKRLTSPQLTARERSRLAFSLAWHSQPEALPFVPSLFDAKGPIKARSNEALISLIIRINDQETLRKVLYLEYSKTNTSGRIVSHIKTQGVGARHWAKLITKTLSSTVNHTQAWRDLSRVGVGREVEWERVLLHNQTGSKLANLVRRLAQHKTELSPSQCTAFSTQSHLLTVPHAQETLLGLLHRGGCISSKSIMAAMKNGSPMATLISGRSSARPNQFFLRQLGHADQRIASIAAQALLLDPKVVEGLKPVNRYAEVLSKQLQPKVQNFYILRLLKELITQVQDATTLNLGEPFIRRIAPFATGKVGEIHTDALLILEKLDTRPARKVIKTALKALNPGQVRVKLFTRFGHILD